MKKIFVALGFIICLGATLNAQHCIGLQKDELAQCINENYKNFNFDGNATNSSFKYLKYTDILGEQTILFFLDEVNKCVMVRHMCDFALINEKINELNYKYTKVEDGKWVYTRGRDTYEVTLNEGEWFFTVTTRRQKVNE